jgi:hypothetical protein
MRKFWRIAQRIQESEFRIWEQYYSPKRLRKVIINLFARAPPALRSPLSPLSVSHIFGWTRGVAVRIEAPKGRNNEAQAKRPGSENTPYLPGSPERARYQPRATRFRGLAEAPVTYRAPSGLEDDPSG